MNEKDYDFVGEPAIEKNGDDNPIVSYWVTYRKGRSETDKDQIMTREEKDLLIKDLCARLPYGVRARFCDGVKEEIDDVWDIDMFSGAINADYIIDDVKPYLRPMSSMTDEETEEYKQFLEDIEGYAYSIDCVPQIDWLNSHHFDYRGLIEKGLALEAPEGMYKEK